MHTINCKDTYVGTSILKEKAESRELISSHLDEDEFCRYVIQRDINGIALDLREAHKEDFFSVPEQAAMALIKNQPSSFAFMLLSFTNGSDQKRES